METSTNHEDEANNFTVHFNALIGKYRVWNRECAWWVFEGRDFKSWSWGTFETRWRWRADRITRILNKRTARRLNEEKESVRLQKTWAAIASSLGVDEQPKP